MKKFEPEYVNYKKRIFGSISYSAIAILFLAFLLLGFDIKYYLLFSLGIVLLLLVWTFYSLMKHSRKYLKSLLINDTYVEFTVVEKDEELDVVKCPLGDIRIRVFELLFNIHRTGRDFKLQIDLKQNGKFVNVFEQYQIGKWNKKIFDEIYNSYCEAKKIPHNKVADIEH